MHVHMPGGAFVRVRLDYVPRRNHSVMQQKPREMVRFVGGSSRFAGVQGGNPSLAKTGGQTPPPPPQFVPPLIFYPQINTRKD